MAAGLEAALADYPHKLTGLLNVPEGVAADLRRIELHPGRPAGSNHPTAAGVAGVERMLHLLGSAGPGDVAVCLLSGGGSALLPAPPDGVTLEDKQAVTKLLHASGATIGEMNAVRKHLSRVKGGRLAEAFRGRLLVSLILSDVVGDPLDVIASGPTAPDPTTFADACRVLERYGLAERVPGAVLRHLQRGRAGRLPETPKRLPPSVHNLVIGNNTTALRAAVAEAERRGYSVLNLGSFVEGETAEVAGVVAGVVRSIRRDGVPLRPPACVLIGGETTVALGPDPGKGGRNQEFALATALKLGADLAGVCVLSGGTDGEDGPTDAAGAIATTGTMTDAEDRGLDAVDHLRRHDSYPFFDAVGGLIRTGGTGTNVTDLRVILVG
jgi:hydroxypyruvate reductase/glycerate 2-kinase